MISKDSLQKALFISPLVSLVVLVVLRFVVAEINLYHAAAAVILHDAVVYLVCMLLKKGDDNETS